MSNKIVELIIILFVEAIIFIFYKMKVNKRCKSGNQDLLGSHKLLDYGRTSISEKGSLLFNRVKEWFTTKLTLRHLIVLIFLYFFIYGGFYLIGNLFGQVTNFNASSKITSYNTDGARVIENGLVVAQNGNTYYISNEDRKLVVLSSPYVTIEEFKEVNEED